MTGVGVVSQATIDRIDKLERSFAVIETRFDGLEATTKEIKQLIQQSNRERFGFKDIWAPMGLAIVIISGIGGLAMQGPLNRIDRIEQHLDHTDTAVETARTERNALSGRLDRIETVQDDRNNARFMADQGIKVAPPAHKR